MLQRLFGRRIINQVAITAGAGFETCVKFSINRRHPLQCNTVRQIGIHAHQPAVFRTHCMTVEMNYLTGCMHTGIGTPRTDNLNRVVSNFRNGRFKSGLNGGFVVVFLLLPTVETGTVIFHDGSVTLHTGGKTRH